MPRVERLDGVLLLRIEARQLGGVAGQLGLAQLLGPLVQRTDQRCRRAGGGDRGEPVDLVADDAVDGRDLVGASVDAGLGEAAQVVDVEERDAGQVVHRRIDVAGDGDVHDQQRAATALGHDRREVVVLDHRDL